MVDFALLNLQRMRGRRRVAFTGHRPGRLYPHLQAYPTFTRWTGELTEFATSTLRRVQPETAIVGMALGWDIAVAMACVRLGIPFTAYIPFVGQEDTWSGREQELYRAYLAQAQNVVVCAPYKLNIAFEERNQAMVDNCTKLVALYDGSPSGTGKTIDYARDQWGIEPLNVWQDWLANFGYTRHVD